jgi:hypothetical protein
MECTAFQGGSPSKMAVTSSSPDAVAGGAIDLPDMGAGGTVVGHGSITGPSFQSISTFSTGQQLPSATGGARSAGTARGHANGDVFMKNAVG